MINMIAAVNKNGVIGKDGKIPWNYPADLRFFLEKTWGGILIMGRKTYESIGRTLPGRLTMVVSKSPGIKDAMVYDSLDSAIKMASKYDREIWLAGGRKIYEAGIKIADVCYLSYIPDNTGPEDAVLFPWSELITNGWIVKEEIKNPHDNNLSIHIIERSKV